MDELPYRVSEGQCEEFDLSAAGDFYDGFELDESSTDSPRPADKDGEQLLCRGRLLDESFSEDRYPPLSLYVTALPSATAAREEYEDPWLSDAPVEERKLELVAVGEISGCQENNAFARYDEDNITGDSNTEFMVHCVADNLMVAVTLTGIPLDEQLTEWDRGFEGLMPPIIVDVLAETRND